MSMGESELGPTARLYVGLSIMSHIFSRREKLSNAVSDSLLPNLSMESGTTWLPFTGRLAAACCAASPPAPLSAPAPADDAAIAAILSSCSILHDTQAPQISGRQSARQVEQQW